MLWDPMEEVSNGANKAIIFASNVFLEYTLIRKALKKGWVSTLLFELLALYISKLEQSLFFLIAIWCYRRRGCSESRCREDGDDNH